MSYFITVQCYASAVYAVHLSICLSQAITVQKWLNIGSRKYSII